MKKKETIWDDILVDEEPGGFKKFIIGVGSWIIVAIFGVALLAGVMWLATMIVAVGNQETTGKPLVIYGLLVLPILLSTVYLLGKTKNLFLKYCKTPLVIGIGINSIIFIAGVGMLTSAYNEKINTMNTLCTDLPQQLEKLQSSTVPIATDLGTGTAFAVNDTYALLTAYHVIEGAKEMYINYVDERIPVTIKAVSPELDVALLTTSKPVDNFMTLTNSYQVADSLYAYGYPGNEYGAGQASVSGGIISRIIGASDLRLNDVSAADHYELIQTDAALNPGNSGGAIINKCGVVGVVSSGSDTGRLHDYLGLASEQGISYAISSKSAAAEFKLPISGN